jgi:hypothetical protein
MDSKAGMKLGRPFMLSTFYSMPHLPGDTQEAASGSGSILAPLGHNRHLAELQSTLSPALYEGTECLHRFL